MGNFHRVTHTCELVCTLQSHTKPISGISISENARLFATVSKNTLIKLWQQKEREYSEEWYSDDYQPSGSSSVCCQGEYLVYVRASRDAKLEAVASLWNISGQR